MAAVAATLLVLLLEVFVIFYPAHRSMVGMIARLRFQAWHDQLTGLVNRARFLARIGEMFEQHKAAKERVFVLALDLDGFKAVNDTLGHPAGDQVLQHVAQVIETTLNAQPGLEDALAARVGGDEFLICGYCPTGDVNALCLELGQALIDAVEVPVPLVLGDNQDGECSVGVSIGVAFGDDAEDDVEAFLGNADIALYVSKRRGKGVTTVFKPGMREDSERETKLKNELKLGLRGLEFQAFFQPQIDMATGKMAGVEALARWNHPTRGLLRPSTFLKTAEEARIIDALDGQIILNAFQVYSQCALEGINLGSLCVNVSAMSLRDPDFCDVLEKVAAGYDIPPGDVTLEIMEDTLVQDQSDPAIEMVHKLSRAGFKIALDDFGIGFSSLAKLSNLDISAIKIDRSLTRQIGASHMEKVLTATASMAQTLDAKLFAEGIETDEQRQVMAEIGVSIAQGFLWARPMSAAALKDWVQNKRRDEVRLVSGL